MSVTGTDGTMG